MWRYRVDFFVNDRLSGHTFVDAWSRKEAWFESWATPQYLTVRIEADRKSARVTFDATRLTGLNEF